MKNNHDLKDKAILFCWIAGLLILISVIWISSQQVQARYLLRAINNVFINNEDSRRISAFIPQKSGKAGILGYWYTMYDSNELMFVFTFFQDGILIPLGAVVSTDGYVNDIIPLSAHAAQISGNLSENILNIYITRIEETAFSVFNGRNR